MAGNVWEWVEHSQIDSNNPHRVVRGGGWFNDGGRLRAAYRLRVVVGLRDCDLGFRVVRSAPHAGSP